MAVDGTRAVYCNLDLSQWGSTPTFEPSNFPTFKLSNLQTFQLSNLITIKFSNGSRYNALGGTDA
jgi:hypothetical protein